MGLREDIYRIFAENTDYKNPGQAVNQASSLNALSADLYTDSKRFIYELLQNADDSVRSDEVVKVWIKIFGGSLVVAHTGSPFNPNDIRGICNINNGTKGADLSKTGYKGIGFKSVFGQADKVIVFTDGEFFRFDAFYSFDWKWDEAKSDWEQKNDRKFQFPWQIIPIYTDEKEVPQPIAQYLIETGATVATIVELKNSDETSSAIWDMSQNLNMFLFLKNICEINFDIVDSVNVRIDRLSKDKVAMRKGESTPLEWIINTVTLTVPACIKTMLQSEQNIPEKLLRTDSIELSLAAKIGNEGIAKLSDQEKLLYAYLPTDETRYTLPVIVNTSFLTTANRESLHVDSKWNQWIFKRIAIEIFNWIAKLVVTEYGVQAYQFIPKRTGHDKLGESFNEGITEALATVPFIVSKDGRLVKLEDTIVDTTYLSEKDFIGEELIKSFISENKSGIALSSKRFARNSNFLFDLRNLGATSFEWKDLYDFLSSTSFARTHTTSDNIKLIKHFKRLCASDKVSVISEEKLMKLPFIYDHKGQISCPIQICFPSADDQNWNNPASDLSFVHPELYNWLLKDSEVRYWLEGIGVQEKTDITYITQTIIPKIDSYITHQNALQAIRDLYGLYKHGDLKEDLLHKLSKIKLLTKGDSLCSADDCFLPDFFRPRLELENIISNDIFVHESYCADPLDRDEWKRFLKMLGVQEGITPRTFSDKISTSELLQCGYKQAYFDTDDKKFAPHYSTFTADSFSNFLTTNFIQSIENNQELANKFWSDCIETYTPNDINAPVIAYWGHFGRPGRTNGNQVENYISWFAKNTQCIPTLSEKCEAVSSVFLNTREIMDVAGKYLPIFNGPELSADWRSFFSFRTTLDLDHYLDILTEIHSDTDDIGNVRSENIKRVQIVYSALLSQCINWSSEDIDKVRNWARDGLLLNTKNRFTECSDLKYFIDGNEAIFQDQYQFMMFSPENRNNPNLEVLLGHFNIQLLKQNEFELLFAEMEVCYSLKNQLRMIGPYFKAWVTSEVDDTDTHDRLEELNGKIECLEIFESEELQITYRGIDFVKGVNLHYDEAALYVTKPWNGNGVFLKLPEVLCRFFNLVGHDKKLDFLLRATDDEIHEYFAQEQLDVPSEVHIAKNALEALAGSQKIDSFADIESAINEQNILPSFYHLSTPDYDRLKYVERLVDRAVANITNHLLMLPEYDCTNIYMIAKSIIGGITKNGNEITVVARPSDNDQVLLYYTSEFDVLEYVDAELWCEDGINIPKQLSLGSLLKKTGINRIPIVNVDTTNLAFELSQNKTKSEVFDFDSVPFTPVKTAQIISSFANTSGGTIIWGVREVTPISNELIGLSTDFQAFDITKKAIMMLSPTPTVSFDWVRMHGKLVFVIKTEKSTVDVLLCDQKYIRNKCHSIIDPTISVVEKSLEQSSYKRTVAMIIAIENYLPKVNQVKQVKYAKNDAMDFKKMLINSMGVAEQNIHMLIDEEAVKSSLEYDFFGLFHDLTEEDRLIFYYVGHGFHNGVTNYLSTYDMHPSHIGETAVSLCKILLDPLRTSKCKNALIFIDACAQNFQYEHERNQITNIDEDELILLTNDFPYYAVFLSCQPGQSSYSSDNLEHGIWTYHLLDAMRGKVAATIRNKKYVTDRLLQDYLADCVYEYTKAELGYEQSPKAILDSNRENIVVEIVKNDDPAIAGNEFRNTH